MSEPKKRGRVKRTTTKAVDNSKREPPPAPEWDQPEPVEVVLPSSVATKPMFAYMSTPAQSLMQQRDAPPPPPGYRYTLDGKLVPFLETRLPVTDRKAQAVFCEVLEASGSFRCACDALGIANKREVENAMLADLDFGDAAEAAADRHRQRMYAHAVQRATVGYQVPIIGGPDKNEIVGYETKVSDTLLALLLKRHFVEFRETKAPKTSNTTNNTLVVNMPDMSKVPRAERDQMRLLLEKNKPKIIDAQAIHHEKLPDTGEGN